VDYTDLNTHCPKDPFVLPPPLPDPHIEANPKKITAITYMGAPQTIKDVQKLTSCMAALNRFIS
jgi:hypothetical protein